MAGTGEKVSVIIPIYNLEDDIERCLKSIISQSYSNLEILLVDDGSTDRSFQICKNFSAGDSRCRLFRHNNHGVSYTRNRGIMEALGEFIIFVDGDDEIAPDMIEQYVSCFSPDIEMVIGGITMIETDGTTCVKKPIPGVFCRKELLQNVCNDRSSVYGYVPNKMYRTNLIKSHNIMFREDMKIQEDLDFALSLYEVVNRVNCISYSGYFYYHRQAKHEIPVTDILRNLTKLCRISLENGCSVTRAVRRLQDQVYAGIFWAESPADIERLYKRPDILCFLPLVEPRGIEKRFVIDAFLSGRSGELYRYFRNRQKIKRLIGSK